jgi:hypothetical protein
MFSTKQKSYRVGLFASFTLTSMFILLIPVAARSTAWVSGRSLAGIAGSNPAGGMDVCLLSLHRAGHSSRGVLPSVVCLSVIVKPRQ